MLIYFLKVCLSEKNKRLIRDELLRYALNENYGLDIKSVKFDKNEYGKPHITNMPYIFFNISYSTNFIVCSVGTSEHGIDVEEIRDFDYYVAKRVFSNYELKTLNNAEQKKKLFFWIWTLKEALGKAKGTGLNYDFKRTTFVINYDSISCSDDSFNYKTFELSNGYMLSAATKEAMEDIEIKEVVMENGELNNVRQSVQKI